MRAHTYGSLRYSRAQLFAGCMSFLLVLLFAAPVSAASSSSRPGSVAPELVVSETDLVVDLDPQFETSLVARLDEGAVGAIDQDAESDTSALSDFRPAGRLDSHGPSATVSNVDGATVGSSRQQYHYLDDNLDISLPSSLKQAVRYDRHQFLSDEYATGDARSDEASVRYDRHQFLADEDAQGEAPTDEAAVRYDHHQFLAGDGVDAMITAGNASGRYDNHQFLSDDNVDDTLTVGGRSAQSDEISFLEENWYFGTGSSPSEELSPLVAEHIAR